MSNPNDIVRYLMLSSPSINTSRYEALFRICFIERNLLYIKDGNISLLFPDNYTKTTFNDPIIPGLKTLLSSETLNDKQTIENIEFKIKYLESIESFKNENIELLVNNYFYIREEDQPDFSDVKVFTPSQILQDFSKLSPASRSMIQEFIILVTTGIADFHCKDTRDVKNVENWRSLDAFECYNLLAKYLI